MNASIPTNRLFVHVRHLVECGYKVGVVKQVETAALKKAGVNKAGPFTRQLKQLYTKSTMIGEEVDASTETGVTGFGGSNFLVCLHEEVTDPDRHTALFSMVAMSLATGEIVYDSFSDDADRGELATRICHIRPVEVLVSQQVSNRTQRFLTSFSSSRAAAPRIEVISAEFYAGYNDFDVIFGS